MANNTKLLSSAMVGAPALSGTIGSMITLLDAALCNGIGLTNVLSIIVLNGIATVNFSSGNTFLNESVLNFSGATPTILNGDKRVLSITGSSLTFDATGVSDVTATGTILVKVASLGFIKSFAGTNIATYKMTNVEGTGFSLCVNDTVTTTARVRGYEVMSSVNTGTGLFPTVAQTADLGLFWSKSNIANTDSRGWYIIGDSRGFYLFVNNYGLSSAFQSFYFGDVLSLKSNDPYACVVRGHTSNQSASQSVLSEDLAYVDSTMSAGGMYVARAPNTLGGAVNAFSCPTLTIGLPLQHNTGGTGWSYPSSVDNGLMLCPLMLTSQVTGYRGYFPGISASPQLTAPHFSTGDYIEGTGSMAGKKVMVIKIGAPSANGNQGVLFVDPISDWRV